MQIMAFAKFHPHSAPPTVLPTLLFECAAFFVYRNRQIKYRSQTPPTQPRFIRRRNLRWALTCRPLQTIHAIHG